MSSLRRGHANLLCIVPILSYETAFTLLDIPHSHYHHNGKTKVGGYSTNQKLDAIRVLINIFFKVCITHQGARTFYDSSLSHPKRRFEVAVVVVVVVAVGSSSSSTYYYY